MNDFGILCQHQTLGSESLFNHKVIKRLKDSSEKPGSILGLGYFSSNSWVPSTNDVTLEGREDNEIVTVCDKGLGGGRK